MQRIEKIEMVPNPVVKFIAFDGKEFLKEDECRNYEFAIKLKRVEEQVETAVKLDDHAPFNGGENYESHSYRWYKPKSIEELELLRDAYGDKFNDSDIGQWVCVETCDHDECWVVPVSDCIAYVNAVLGPMGYEMTIKAKEAA